MPFVEIKIIEGELPEDEIKKLIEDVTDVVVSHIGENLRDVTWVVVKEVKSGCWGVGGKCIRLEDIKAMQAGATDK